MDSIEQFNILAGEVTEKERELEVLPFMGASDAERRRREKRSCKRTEQPGRNIVFLITAAYLFFAILVAIVRAI